MSAVWICVARSVSMTTGRVAMVFPRLMDFEEDLPRVETRRAVEWVRLIVLWLRGGILCLTGVAADAANVAHNKMIVTEPSRIVFPIPSRMYFNTSTKDETADEQP